MVSPAILYGTQCWMIKDQHEIKVSVANMMILCWMYGKTKCDKIINEIFRECYGNRYRLMWFKRVERKLVDFVVKIVD